MVRRFAWAASALACSLLVAGSAGAQQSFTNDPGYVVGDPSSGKLLPYYQFSGDLATLVGLENTALNPEGRDDIFVHIEIFDVESNPQFSKTICLTQGDFGYLVLQQAGPSETQQADIDARCGPDSPHPTPPSACKATVLSEEITNLASTGYVTFAARRANDNPDTLARIDRACEFGADFTDGDLPDQASLGGPQLYAWGVLQDVSEGFFGTEIPAVSAGVNFRQGAPGGTIAEPCGTFDNGLKGNDTNGGSISDPDSAANKAGAGTACLLDTSRNGTNDGGGSGHFGGLASGDRRVGGRYDCNPANTSTSTLIVWAQNNYDVVVPIIARGEDEGCFNGSIPLPIEVNVIDMCDLAPIRESTATGQFRGAVEFVTPGTTGVDGFFLFSLITQADQNFVLTQNAYITSQDTVNDAISIICPAVGF